jgi:hypothetical protein
MTTYSNEYVCEFVKINHEDFVFNEYPEDLQDQMTARTYRDWCDMVANNNDFKISPLMKKYFDFKQLLTDEWNYSACMGGEEYYLARVDETDKNKSLKLIEDIDEFNVYYKNCWVITMPIS